MTTILFLGDVFGDAGVNAVCHRLARLRHDLGVDFCIANAENADEGHGITACIAERLFRAGVDVITLGDHLWSDPEVGEYVSESSAIVRPVNLAGKYPGRASTVGLARDGTRVCVISILGALGMRGTAAGPFEVVDDLVVAARGLASVVICDFHGVATNEKAALSRWLDSRVTAVIGTHTHVQTNDARVLPGGTACITDAGMTGPHDSVLGLEIAPAIDRLRTGMACDVQPAVGDVRLEGVVIECEPGGRALDCRAIRVSS